MVHQMVFLKMLKQLFSGAAIEPPHFYAESLDVKITFTITKEQKVYQRKMVILTSIFLVPSRVW